MRKERRTKQIRKTVIKNRPNKSRTDIELLVLYEKSISISNELVQAIDDEDREACKTLIELMKNNDEKIKNISEKDKK